MAKWTYLARVKARGNSKEDVIAELNKVVAKIEGGKTLDSAKSETGHHYLCFVDIEKEKQAKSAKAKKKTSK